MKKTFLHIFILMLLVACSTTSQLPEGEMLYTGIKEIEVEDRLGTLAEENALLEVEAALAYQPNGSFMGSSSLRSPFQVGLWTYNAYVNKSRKGFNKWLFDSFSTPPVTISHVSPDMRAKVATNLLQNYGYFRGKVDYELVNQKNPKQQKIAYHVKLDEPYLYDSIQYRFPAIEDSILRATADDAYVHKGGQFSTLDLTSEKTRIVNAFRDNGFYYYRPDYVTYLADSTNAPYRVTLCVLPDIDMPQNAKQQYYFGNVSAYIRQPRVRTNRRQASTEQRSTETRQRMVNQYTDSLMLNDLKIVYQGDRMPVAPRVLFKNFKFWKRRLFNQSNVDKTIANLHSMNIFSGMKFTFTPRDTTLTNDTLDVRLELTMDQLVDAELDFNITQKSNSQVGPSLGLILSKRNAFHHGETLSVGLKGSYEWQTQKQFGENKRIDSYELGLDMSLSYPWIAFPGLNKQFFRYPASTTYRLNINQLNRANYYRLMSFIAEAKYGFQTSRSWSHELTPLTISYNKMQHTTARFDSIVANNSALYVSLRDQFIPAMQYSIIYDNTWNTRLAHSMHFEGTVKESGNLLNTANSIIGIDYHKKDKKLLGTPYSQFLKFTFTLNNQFRVADKSTIATRVQLGAIWTYGNSRYAPYSELFYVGGANSIRAFAVRSIGPGSYLDREGRGTYLDQAGDMKFELNAEYRFPIVNALQGAFFIDAGNVWLMRKDDAHPGGQFKLNRFLKDMALGTGLGVRYDLDFLILRLDLGIGIHAPYDTGKSGYYNIRKFSDGLGFHFAVGYPF
jgi:outer membrane protein assembly factor BamA